jgi:NAD(P)-dependent dehydrogenase (short-subunit alcohol dehydrogenase family)
VDCETSAPKIVAAMCEAVPPGRMTLTAADLAKLGALTRALVDARPEAAEEARRYHSIGERSLELDDAEVRGWIAGKRVLVTGGTGCIGSTLLGQLVNYGAARITSISRGQTRQWPRHEGVVYLHADVTDPTGLAVVFDQARPDLVFHLAGQREPGLAEREVQLTLGTNLLGTVLVTRACAKFGVAELVAASTGKALRPYSREVYTASKRLAEWALASIAAGSGMTVSTCRYTHVVDNSIVHRRLLEWARRGVVRLHDPATVFYVQSARESARLMLISGLRARPAIANVTAIRDLGWPVSLVDLALGTLREQCSDSPIYFSGHDPGYECVPFPGLYDPATAGDLSPLLSVFDTAADIVKDDDIDVAALIPQSGAITDALVSRLGRICQQADPAVARSVLDELSWQAFDATLAGLPSRTLQRIARRTDAYGDELTCDHSRMLTRIRDFAGSADLNLAGSGVRS